MRLTGPDPDTRQPHGRRARGAGPRHPRGPCRFLHGRVRVPQDARPVVGAGPGSGRDRPRLGDGHHAGTGSPRRAPRRDVRHRQTGEGARAAGPASWDAGSFMAVYGCRKTRARSSAQGRDPAGIGRGWVMDIMREPGVRGVRRGGTSVTARPAKGRGRRARPRGTRVRGGAPGPAARGRHRLRAHGQRTLRLHGARPPTCSPAGVCDQIKVFGVRW